MHYRDEQATLEARHDELRRELAAMAERADALRAAVENRDALECELAAVEARLGQKAARRLPLLERVQVAAPCSADWDEMKGDERVRFCGSCQTNVYNLSAMPRDEAEQLLAEREGSICVRLYQRADGTVMTSDCAVGVRRRRRRRTAFALAGVGGLAATALAALAAVVPTQGKMVVRSAPVMGSAALVDDDPPAPPVMGTAAVPAAPPPTAPETEPSGSVVMGKPAAPAPPAHPVMGRYPIK